MHRVLSAIIINALCLISLSMASIAVSAPVKNTETYMARVNLVRSACQTQLNIRLKAQFEPQKLADYCDCSAKGVISNLSQSEFDAIQTQGPEGILSDHKFKAPVEQCMKQHLLSY